MVRALLGSGRMRRFAILASLAAMGCLGGGESAGLPGGEPVGSYALERTLVDFTPCPAFAEPAEVAIAIVGDTVLVTTASGEQPAEEVVIDGGRVEFVTHESWTSPDGDAWPALHYELEQVGDALEGEASTSFPFDTETAGTTCEYRWTVSGTPRS
jgi:hypothetical protein